MTVARLLTRAAAGALAAATLAACSSTPAADRWNRAPLVRNIDGSVDGHVEVVKRGDTLAVHLEGNPTTGYRWELVRLAGESVAQVGNADYQPETAAGVPRVGAPGHTTFRFRATKPGTSVVELAYRRAWEKSVAPAKAVRFEIAVP
ncbi:MAG: protease inhibitor I42 family protein [Burkholderiales bacterium]